MIRVGPGPYSSVDILGGYASEACALRESGDLDCWDLYSALWRRDGAATVNVFPGPYRAVGAGGDTVCAVEETGALDCWPGHSTAEGPFRMVSVAEGYECSMLESGELHWSCGAPAGSFRSVSAGTFYSCGVRESGEVVCWGSYYSPDTDGDWEPTNYGQGNPPAGAFRSVDTALQHACGVRESGEVVCWGGQWVAADVPPDLRYMPP